MGRVYPSSCNGKKVTEPRGLSFHRPRGASIPTGRQQTERTPSPGCLQPPGASGEGVTAVTASILPQEGGARSPSAPVFLMLLLLATQPLGQHGHRCAGHIQQLLLAVIDPLKKPHFHFTELFSGSE